MTEEQRQKLRKLFGSYWDDEGKKLVDSMLTEAHVSADKSSMRSVLESWETLTSLQRENEANRIYDDLVALEKKWREQAIDSREEAGRIRRTVYVATEAEANCFIRAEVWDAIADELAERLYGKEGR